LTPGIMTFTCIDGKRSGDLLRSSTRLCPAAQTQPQSISKVAFLISLTPFLRDEVTLAPTGSDCRQFLIERRGN